MKIQYLIKFEDNLRYENIYSIEECLEVSPLDMSIFSGMSLDHSVERLKTCENIGGIIVAGRSIYIHDIEKFYKIGAFTVNIAIYSIYKRHLRRKFIKNLFKSI